MENASKALIIAGSVLIVILLIGFGMRIFNSSSGTADQVEGTMQTTETATFNSKFTSYIGTKKNRAQVMSLLNTVIANNSTNSAHTVKINNSDSISEKMNTLGNGPFTISIDPTNGYSNGFIVDITVTYKVSGVDTKI